MDELARRAHPQGVIGVVRPARLRPLFDLRGCGRGQGPRAQTVLAALRNCARDPRPRPFGPKVGSICGLPAGILRSTVLLVRRSRWRIRHARYFERDPPFRPLILSDCCDVAFECGRGSSRAVPQRSEDCLSTSFPARIQGRTRRSAYSRGSTCEVAGCNASETIGWHTKAHHADHCARRLHESWG